MSRYASTRSNLTLIVVESHKVVRVGVSLGDALIYDCRDLWRHVPVVQGQVNGVAQLSARSYVKLQHLLHQFLAVH